MIGCVTRIGEVLSTRQPQRGISTSLERDRFVISFQVLPTISVFYREDRWSESHQPWRRIGTGWRSQSVLCRRCLRTVSGVEHDLKVYLLATKAAAMLRSVHFEILKLLFNVVSLSFSILLP